MLKFHISPAAKDDISSVLSWTHEHFGESARHRYEALLMCSMFDVAENPDRSGCIIRTDIAAGLRTYHLWHSRRHVSEPVGTVRHPRHLLMYRVLTDGRVEILRVLYDGMDIAEHAPKNWD